MPAADGAILIVDDEQVNRSLLSAHLNAAGFGDLHEAMNGQEALDVIEHHVIDLVLLDLHMPEVDGLGVLRALNSQQPMEFRPVIAVTADVTAEIRRAALRAGATDFVTKPIDGDEVVLRCTNLLRARALHRAAQELLEATLVGTVDALFNTLSLADPAAFARAERVADLVARVVPEGDPRRWSLQVAASMAHLGAVSLPVEINEKINGGVPLSTEEKDLARRVPAVSTDLLSGIPRLEPVIALIRAMGRERRESDPPGTDLLRMLSSFEEYACRDLEVDEVMSLLGRQSHFRELPEFATLREAVAQPVFEVDLDALRPGWTLAQDVVDPEGILLLARGMKVTNHVVERLRGLASTGRIPDRVAVRAPERGALVTAEAG